MEPYVINFPEEPLAEAEFFGGSNLEFRNLISNQSQLVQLEKGQTLFFQNDPGDAVYIVESGSVEISILNESGKKLILNIIRPPEVFGEIAAFDGGPRTATATATEPTMLSKIARNQVFEIIEANPSLASGIVKFLCGRLRWISQQVEDHTLNGMEARLAKKLVILHDRFSDREGILKMSQSDLADFLGITRESVNKIFQTWRENNFIELSRGTIKVLDRSKLQKTAGTEY